MIKKERYLIFILTLLLLVSLSSAVSNNSVNNSIQERATSCLNESRAIMGKMLDSGFNVQRVNDTIKQAQFIFESQLILKDKKKNYDFSPIIPMCDQIVKINEDAVMAREDLAVLLKVYNDSIVPGMNTSSIDSIIDEIKGEIKSERYEKVNPLINKAYLEISNIKASYTALNVFYKNTATGLKNFILKRWKVISTLLILALVFFLIYRIEIAKWLVKRKIENLKIRKKTIKELVMNLQRDYFQLGNIPEETFNIRTKKFTELIRDIDRQVPLLQEELARLESLRGYKKV